MKLHRIVFVLLLGIFFTSACTSPASVPTDAAPNTAPTIPPPTAPPTDAPISTRVERRAPTLESTATETEIPPATEIPSATATEFSTATRAATETAIPAATDTRPPVTATALLEKAVYVTALKIEPPAPKAKPAEFFFTVNFLNTVGENVNYPRWRVLIFPKGQSRAIGDPQGVSKTIVNGVSQQTTENWSINLQGVCETFVAQPAWEGEDGSRNPFPQPNGANIELEFQVCP